MLVEEYEQILRRFINFSQWFGLAPLSASFATSKTKFAICVVYLFLQAGHAIYQLTKIYDRIRLDTMANIIHFVWMFQCLVTNVSVTAQSLLVARHLAAYVNELCHIDKAIHSNLQLVPNYQRQSRKHLLTLVFVIAVSLMLAWTLYGFLAAFHPQLSSLFAFIFLPIGFMSIRAFQIIHSIELLNDHLDVINNRLRSVSTIHDEWNEGALTDDLIALRQLYGRCWNALQLYNDCFGFSNLMLVLFYSFDVLHGIFNLFLNLRGYRPDLVVLYGICFIPSAITLFAITNAAVRCRNKAKETGVRLGNIWNRPSCHVDLKRFSVQVIHQQFLMTAYGFFVVDFEFLGGIAVGFSNLLLLFIQFEISENTT